MDRLDAMRAFVSVTEQRGFANAARHLGVSPSAVTRLVAALEGHLGLELLRRTTRSVALTDAGRRYLARAQQILEDVAEAEGAARAERVDPTGRLSVSAPLVFGRQHVTPLLSDYLTRYPGVTGELMLTDRYVHLIDEGIDVAVRIGHLEDSSLRVRTVGRTRRILVASPRYLAQRKRLRSPADLAACETIQLTPLTPTAEWVFHGRGRSRRVAIKPTLVTNSADAAIAHALHGSGIAMVLSYQVAAQLADGTLQVVLATHQPPALPIQLVHSSTRAPSATVRAFVELATQQSWHWP